MMITKSQLRALILEEMRILGEAEGEDKPEEEAEPEDDLDLGAEEPGDEESSEEEGGEGEEDAASEGEDETEEDKKSEKVEAPRATGPVGDEVDAALRDVMADFEKRALDTAAGKAKLKPIDVVKSEGRMSLARLLFEDNVEVVIDVGTFAADVARLINNYDTLIDMEGVIYAKAKDFLEKKYGKDYADQLQDILAREYDIEINDEYDPEKAERPIYAVGSSTPTGAA